MRGASRSFVIPVFLVLSALWPAPALPAQAAAAPPPSFEEVAAKAARARDAGSPDDAIRWYRRGVRMRPRWDEGWWYLATLLYEQDRYAEAATAFGRFLALKPEAGPALALRGLCEFQVKDFAASLRHLGDWMAAGSAGNDETRQVAWYHLAILRIRGNQFELALEPMTQLCRSGPESPRVTRAAGLMLLRLATFPAEVPQEKEALVDAAGRAVYSWLAVKVDDAHARFKELIERFPDAPNAHYGYGLFLLGQGSEEALVQFREEIKVQPRSVYPRLEMAFELLKRGDYAEARPYAESAVDLAPALFAAHDALGRVLVELGDVPRGVAELEEAARLAPESPEVFFALAQAYGRAGRKEEAAQARATFQKLEAARKAKRSRAVAGEAALPRASIAP